MPSSPPLIDATFADSLTRTWGQVLPDTPLLLSIASDDFSGVRAHRTTFAVGIFAGEWVVGHVHAQNNAVSVSAGPFDFPEQAVAAFLAMVVHDRALNFSRSLVFAGESP